MTEQQRKELLEYLNEDHNGRTNSCLAELEAAKHEAEVIAFRVHKDIQQLEEAINYIRSIKGENTND